MNTQQEWQAIDKPETRTEPRYVEIVYNGKVYGQWNQEANQDYPEDLIFGRDLNELVDIGIEIGKQIQKDSEPIAPIDKTLSAERFIEKCTGEPESYRINIRNHSLLTLMEAYGDLRVEQAKEEWRKQNNDILMISMNAASNNYFYADAIMTSNSIEEVREKVKINVKFLNNGK